MNIEIIKEDVKKALSEYRYIHSLGVMERAGELAKIYGEDIETAMLVGIAHDMAKEFSDEEMLKYAEANNLEMDEIERKMPALLHGRIAGDICKKRYGFTDEMTRSMDLHTTGFSNMTKLDKILYIADKTEPNRKFPDLEEAIEICNSDLDKGMLYCLDVALKENIRKGKIIHPNTIIARNDILCNLNII